MSVWLSIVLLTAPQALATVPDQFGMGADNIGLAGASTAVDMGPSAAYYNPAGISGARHVMLQAHYVLGQANLQGWEGIVYDSNADGKLQDADGYPDYGDVGADYRVRDPEDPDDFYVNGMQVGLVFPIWRWLAIGLSAYLPHGSLLRLEVEDPYIPYYVMYRNRNNRFTANPALSIQPIHGVHLGAGAQVMADISARVRLTDNTTIQAFSASDTSDASVSVTSNAHVDELVANVVPRTGYNWGALIELGAFVPQDDPKYDWLNDIAVGVAWRGAWFASTDADILVAANGTATFDDETLLDSPLLAEPVEATLSDLVSFYNPPQLSIGLKAGYRSFSLSGDATRVGWSHFTEMVVPYTVLEVNSLAGTSVTVQSGDEYPDPGFRDTWNLRGGIEYTTPKIRLPDLMKNARVHVRGGYAWIPTPVPDQTGLTNYMDSDRSVYAGGLGFEVDRIRGFSRGPLRLDVGAQYHALETRTVEKDASLLSDTDGDGLINYPRGWALPADGQTSTITSAGNLWVVAAGITLQFGDEVPLPGKINKPPRPARPDHGARVPVETTR